MFVAPLCVCMCMRARRCISTMKILWVLILKPVLRGGIHVIQVSHGIVLPAKLHYHSWGDGVGNSVFPNQVPNGEPNTCDVATVQTTRTPQSLIWTQTFWPYLKLNFDFHLICMGISALWLIGSSAIHPLFRTFCLIKIAPLHLTSIISIQWGKLFN